MQEKWMQNLTIEDMPNEVFQDIAERCGLEAAKILLTEFQGTNIYIPTDGFKKLRDSYILKNFDGSTASLRRLAMELRVSEQCIRDVLKKSKNLDINENQLQLFKETEFNRLSKKQGR